MFIAVFCVCGPKYTAQFKEKTAEEVLLPGKKSAEIREMSLVI